jgi:acetylornithine deacetylase/succinyl-diaminopimelate desuccinylase-like protein
VFAATTGEEGTGDLRGARHLFETAGRGARAAIAIDGAGDERVVTSSLGSLRYRVTYRGSGGHSWAAFGLPNAVHAAAGLAVRLTATELAAHPRSTLTVSRIGGGSAVNAIPADGWIDVDMRSTSTNGLARLDQRLRTAAREALDHENNRRRAGTDPLTVELQSLGHRPAGEVAEEDALVQAALGATRAVGRHPEMAIASTDANIPISLGIPAIAIGGGGRGGDTHTTHEWFENIDGPRGVVRALVLLAAAANLA